MKKYIKKFIAHAANEIVKFLKKTILGEYVLMQFIQSIMNQDFSVHHGGVEAKFSSPNGLCAWRYKTFSDKEPETLEWIDAMEDNSLFWDIGANIGIYSIYAALKKNSKVWAFEPSVFNLEILAKNIYLNNLANKVCIVPLALSNKVGESFMQMTSLEWGGALSTFGENYGWDGSQVNKIFEYSTLGVTMNMVRSEFQIPQPNYIKLDVDGIEHLILQGGVEIISNVKSLLVEVNESFEDQYIKCHSLLMEAGLSLRSQHALHLPAQSIQDQNTFNQIWTRF